MARGRQSTTAPQAAPAAPVEPAAPVQPRCGACRFYAGGCCHRYPPPNDYLPPRMPPTLAHLWCGEFRP